MTEQDLPKDRSRLTTSASAIGQVRLVCPMHGLLSPTDRERCSECGRQPYRLDDDSDRAMLANLRRVARSQRMNVARLLGFLLATPASFLVMALVTGQLTFSAAHVLIILGGSAGLAVPIEHLLRYFTPLRLKPVDRELLEAGDSSDLHPTSSSLNR